jgi:hypothetical protein
MVAGAPFFFAGGEGDRAGLGVSSSPGVALGLADGAGDSSGVGVGEGDGFRFFFFGEALGEEPGDGVGEAFFFLGETEALGSGFSVGVGLAAAFFFFEEVDEGDFSGVGDGFGVGDFSATSFFFAAVELLRCFRGVGEGVGAKIFLILVPNDSSDCACSGTVISAIEKSATAIALPIGLRVRDANLLVIPSEVEEPRGTSSDIRRGPSTSLCCARDDTLEFATPSPARPKPLYSGECRHPCSRAGNSR